jgi:HlyD family secretion protein
MPSALTVQVVPVREQTLQRPVIGDGSVVAWQELVVGIEAGGLRVAEVPIEEGDRVTRGQVLARLDDAVLVAQAGSARAAVAEVEAALALAQADLRRATELSRTDAVARQTLEQRQANLRQTEARLLSARARLEEAEARQAQTLILAPADGIVARRSVLPGAVAQPGQEVARLIRDGRLELAARVPELELPGIAPGQRVRVRHGAAEIEGEVRAVAPVVGADTRLGTVHVALPAGSGLRPGMFAQAEIMPGARPALVVPNEAVIFRDGRSAAFVLPEASDQVTLRRCARARGAAAWSRSWKGCRPATGWWPPARASCRTATACASRPQARRQAMATRPDDPGYRNISAWGIRNPIPVAVMFLLLTLGGLFAFPQLRIKQHA